VAAFLVLKSVDSRSDGRRSLKIFSVCESGLAKMSRYELYSLSSVDATFT
jgi:hypothetical protein